jgi:hypothetical protein
MKSSQTEAERGPAYRIQSVGGGWGVFDHLGRSVSERMGTQADAVAHSKELARGSGSAQIIVYDEHGKLVSEFFYQRDERPSLDFDNDTRTRAASHPTTVAAGTREGTRKGP